MRKIFLFTMIFLLVACWGVFGGNPVLLAAEKMMGKDMPAKTGEMKGTEGMMKKEMGTMEEKDKMKQEGEMKKEEKEMKKEEMMKETGKMK